MCENMGTWEQVGLIMVIMLTMSCMLILLVSSISKIVNNTSSKDDSTSSNYKDNQYSFQDNNAFSRISQEIDEQK